MPGLETKQQIRVVDFDDAERVFYILEAETTHFVQHQPRTQRKYLMILFAEMRTFGD